MKPSQLKIKELSPKICIILKLGLIASIVVMALALLAIGILMFSGEDVKSSFLAAFEVTANNGTTIGIGLRPLLIMFLFMLVDTALISLALLFVHAVFEEMKRGCTPFTPRNTVRIQKVAGITALLSIVGGYSDALVDYYTIGELCWRANVTGLMIAAIIYCISLIFSYGCDLQQESDETL